MIYSFPESLNAQAKDLIDLCRKLDVRLATVESCTGGLLAGCLTDIAGSSDVVDRGFVTYSNEAKHEEVGVTLQSLETFGAVSEQVACEMCSGALTRQDVGAAASITGIAGPGGGTEEKPVGLVYIGIGVRNHAPVAHRFIFDGSRQEVRNATLATAVDLLIKALGETR